jgi:hypothetical protein
MLKKPAGFLKGFGSGRGGDGKNLRRSTLTSISACFTRCRLAWDKARLGSPGLGW